MKSRRELKLISLGVATILMVALFSVVGNDIGLPFLGVKGQAAAVMLAPVPYTRTVYHIFFHSLIVYPELAFNGNKESDLYSKYMITRDQFEKILPQLYKNNFVLINMDSLMDGKPPVLPVGKKPLIISIDDLSYYHSMAGHGFADKLVLDENGNVATEIVTPEGTTEVTRDGDVVPILDDFVAAHPDFSYQGAKGVIAVTGFEGVLGYRTDSQEVGAHPQDVSEAKAVIAKLKNTGWLFASHSYSHDTSFSNGSISLSDVQKDTTLWNQEVEPLVGTTDIFIGPFGQVFSPNDPRRNYLISQGFKILAGVGMDGYERYFSNVFVMDRADIDGYRLIHTPQLLTPYFDPTQIGS